MSDPERSRGLIDGFIFESFVEGEASKIALSVVRSLSENGPGRITPLFLFGDQGVGKTHLMQAFGHAVLKRAPTTKLVCISAERFSWEVLTASKQGSVEEYRARHRDLDVLLVDDIQFLEHKPDAMTEMVSLIDWLARRGKQAMTTSDPSPKEIAGMAMDGGVAVRVGTPDIETRLKILDRTTRELGVTLPEDVALHLASMSRGNVRALLGAIRRLLTYSRRDGIPIDLELAKRALLQGL